MHTHIKKTSNRSLVWLLFVGILVCLSCEQELMKYQGEEGIYFAVQYGRANESESKWPFQPMSKIALGGTTNADTTVRFKVMVTGPAYDYDRSFQVEINPDLTTAIVNTHYKPLAPFFIIPAGQVQTYIPLTIIRSADLKSAGKEIGLRLLPSEQLSLSFPEWDAIPGFDDSNDPIVGEFDASLHQITIQDVLTQPTVWRGSVAADGLEGGPWGAYTEKKILLMCEVMSISYVDFGSNDTMPQVLINLLSREMARYLTARFNADDPVLEEDGRLMYVTGVSWRSYVGVPYKK